jgi:hypothetical protein
LASGIDVAGELVGKWSQAGALKKAAQIIMARDHGDIELVDRKVFNFLLYRVFQELRPDEAVVHSVPVSDVLNFLGHSSTDRLNECLSRLSSMEMVIDYVDEAGIPNSARTHYLSYNMERTADGWIRFAFDPILLRFLHKPKVFALLAPNYLAPWRSDYAAKLFEVLSLYVNRHHKVWEPSVEKFRETMNVGDGYQRFDNLKKRIIETAVEEVNAIAPFNVAVDYVRGGVGGKVVSVRFTVLPKGPKTLLDLSAARATGRRDGRRDPNTPDLIDGLTDEERRARGVSPEAMERALSLLPGGEALDGYLDAWRTSVAGRNVRDADRSFLNWLEIELARRADTAIGRIDEDTIATLLETWERRT